MSDLAFVKLGGSVITDKARPETARPAVIARLAEETAAALEARPDLRLLLGHGSGSFGHTVARRYGTRRGVRGADQWQGFVRVAAVAARLNRLVTDAFLAAGVPVWSLQPSASARCRDGRLRSLETAPVETALSRGLVPLLYGDVALDETLGGTILSTEQIFTYLAPRLRPARLILVGTVDGVFESDPLRDPSARPVPCISAANWERVRGMLSGSHAADVTGGMRSKVEAMVDLVRRMPGLTVHLLSGERPGALRAALLEPEAAGGTVIRFEHENRND
ncbi:MAG TPA: isopentenyl phosphate kinase family protein [Anaerolineae bacterium]|nr:isopentenyl phosphate kinase family protein [Anaerolineae bacterium]